MSTGGRISQSPKFLRGFLSNAFVHKQIQLFFTTIPLLAFVFILSAAAILYFFNSELRQKYIFCYFSNSKYTTNVFHSNLGTYWPQGSRFQDNKYADGYHKSELFILYNAIIENLKIEIKNNIWKIQEKFYCKVER